ncbi:hypothetical protein ACWD4N_03795, partial [Streptomyces sp. NPDC002586]
MPGSPQRALKLAGVVTAVQTTAVLLATRAFAEPSPTSSGSPSPAPSKSKYNCDVISGEAKKYCERGNTSSGSGGANVPDTSTLDPLSSLAKGCAEAASWTIDKLSKAVKETANVDFTNPKFLQQYAIVFAAS